MRVLLIKAGLQLKEIPRLPLPLGLLTIGTLLKQAGDKVEILDTRLYWRAPPVAEVVRRFKPDLVGISALTVESRALHEIAGAVRSHAPAVPIVVGGPHASSYTDDVLADPSIDYAVVCEGDRTILGLRAVLLEGADPAGVPGLAWRDAGGETRINEDATPLTSEELDAMPFLDLGLADLPGYMTHRSSSVVGPCRQVAVSTSRGCPYLCTYCNSIFGKKIRAQSPQRVLDELKYIHETRGVTHFEFFDDAFLANRKRAEGILEGIVKSGMPLRLIFSNGLRADRLTDEMVDLLAEAGAIYIGLGIETAVPRLQEAIKKRLDLDKTAAIVERLAKRRIFNSGFLMIGFPDETYEEAKTTVDYACSLPLHSILIHLVTPFRGTPLGAEVGDVIIDPEVQASYMTTNVNLSRMSDREMTTLRRNGYLRFFGDPRRIYRIVRDHPNRRHIPSIGLAFLRNLLLRVDRAGTANAPNQVDEKPPPAALPPSRRTLASAPLTGG